jgi:hypothetical protein
VFIAAFYASKCIFMVCCACEKFWYFVAVFLCTGTTLLSCNNSTIENRTIEDVIYTLAPGPSKMAQLPLEVFGKVAWAYYLSHVDEEPVLPGSTEEILDSTCPCWVGRKVKEMHLLVLIPAMVNGLPFTLDLLPRLIKHLKDGPSVGCVMDDDSSSLQKNLGKETPRTRAYWILMTRDVVPATRGKGHNARQGVLYDILRNHAGYKLPSVLEAATTALTHYVRSNGEWIYAEASTYCGQKPVDNQPDERKKKKESWGKTIFLGEVS